ncbi:nitrous oxide reductase accessory protein NosL [Rhodohalobacter halophilus]|uniref:nitrous oxide reductase accessory protein NosL n=1 Tax=Rhodohalobacter halophilus TaxID=1812810 RepID=UPI00083F6348|nr:nitrous oxide reductase accessory protein NosL [Rhodohalobacter halophilus]
MRGGSKIKLIVFSALILIGCEPKPQPINYGSDECAYCRMMITDAEFGSQIVNNQGRAYKFDSVECMAAYDLTEDGENVHSKWVPNFLDREEWLNAEDAVYLHSETLRSPMGLFLSAYRDRSSAEEMREEYGGEIVDYESVKEIVEREWLSNGSGGQQMMNR